jgi:hypothetical protein
MQAAISTNLLMLLCRATPEQLAEVERMLAGVGWDSGMLIGGALTDRRMADGGRGSRGQPKFSFRKVASSSDRAGPAGTGNPKSEVQTSKEIRMDSDIAAKGHREDIKDEFTLERSEMKPLMNTDGHGWEPAEPKQGVGWLKGYAPHLAVPLVEGMDGWHMFAGRLRFGGGNGSAGGVCEGDVLASLFSRKSCSYMQL